MIIDDIIQKLDVGGPRSYYYFETFIQHLFKHHIEEQEKSFLITDERSKLGDAFAPEGFDDFDGPTLIEIKFNPGKMPPTIFINRLVDQISVGGIDPNISNLLIISAKPVPRKFLTRFEELVENLTLPYKVIFWGPDEINRIASKNRKIANNIANNLFSLRLESAITKPLRNWNADREEIIEKLKESYRKGQFSLFLGAGVSSSAGMPDWNTLLNSLFVTYLTKEFDGDIATTDEDIGELASRLNSIDEPSALMAARYLRKGLSKQKQEAKEFIDTVTKNLYKLRKPNFDINSRLIRSIASMCLPRRTGAKVRSVVTYNFDDLLERQLTSQSILHSCIYSDKESYDPDELPVYHVHGFLPEDKTSYQGLENSTLVFSEEGYHQIYSDSYHWSNLVQLNSFRENNCLMIGLSMTDPNLRRLLDISSRNIERSKHYAFMKRLSNDDFCFSGAGKDKVKVITNIDAAEKFLNRHHKLNEELMKELGVTIIWYEAHDEIPKIIDKILQH